MNVRLGISLKVFKGARQIYIQMKAYVLPFKNNITILNLANVRHTLKTLHVYLALLQLAGVLSGSSTIQCAVKK